MCVCAQNESKSDRSWEGGKERGFFRFRTHLHMQQQHEPKPDSHKNIIYLSIFSWQCAGATFRLQSVCIHTDLLFGDGEALCCSPAVEEVQIQIWANAYFDFFKAPWGISICVDAGLQKHTEVWGERAKCDLTLALEDESGWPWTEKIITRGGGISAAGEQSIKENPPSEGWMCPLVRSQGSVFYF